MNIETHNIREGCGFGILQVIWATQMGNYDLMILTKTNILDVVYCMNRLGYDIACFRAAPNVQCVMQGGGFTRERPEICDAEGSDMRDRYNIAAHNI